MIPFDPGISREPAWSIDLRHCRWLYEVLSQGQFLRVLEIGSYRGYSTQAFLAALRAGSVAEVWVCEPHPTPELLALLEGVAGVQLDTRKSVDLLAADGDWDLVFVDGDHAAATVVEETRLLIEAGVPALFAHDTAMTESWCDGPPRLKAMVQAAGYYCIEDSLIRPDELTHRGMLFAARGLNRFAFGYQGYLRTCSS